MHPGSAHCVRFLCAWSGIGLLLLLQNLSSFSYQTRSRVRCLERSL